MLKYCYTDMLQTITYDVWRDVSLCLQVKAANIPFELKFPGKFLQLNNQLADLPYIRGFRTTRFLCYFYLDHCALVTNSTYGVQWPKRPSINESTTAIIIWIDSMMCSDDKTNSNNWCHPK